MQSRVSFRLQDSDGFTQPIDIHVGDLVQWRNLGLIEITHGLKRLTRDLDILYPLDNTFGGVFEDLDDRRIPLWMLRGSYNFGRVGPVSALTVEGFWVPGNWDVRVAPVSPVGTPYAAPQPESPLPTVVIIPGFRAKAA